MHTPTCTRAHTHKHIVGFSYMKYLTVEEGNDKLHDNSQQHCHRQGSSVHSCVLAKEKEKENKLIIAHLLVSVV